MPYQNTVMDLSLRIALYVAHATMRSLGWDQAPELSVSSIIMVDGLSTKAAQYVIRYPLWENPNRVNDVEVWIGRGQDGKWSTGQLAALGWWQSGRPFNDGYRQQSFHISWSKNGAPIIEFGTFTQLSESPPPLAQLGEHFEMAMTYGEGQVVAGEQLAGELGMTAPQFRDLLVRHGCWVRDEGEGMSGCFAVRATEFRVLLREGIIRI
jgi:hypothetical protein